MKILASLAVIAAIAVGYPLFNEHAGNSCLALEKRWLTVVGPAYDAGVVESWFARSVLDAGEGLFAREYARRKVSELPPVITCYGYYWYSIADRRWLHSIRLDL